jgi:hypothetical protein
MAENADKVARLYEDAEEQAAKAAERLVGSQGFGALLGQVAENTAALSKLASDTIDLTLRNLRLAGRRDIVRLSRQLARTEDKLERVLQEVEALRADVARRPGNEEAAAQGNGRTRQSRRRSADSSS